MKKIKVISCITTVMVMAAIFFFSSQNGSESSEVSMGVSRELAELIKGLFSKIGCFDNITADNIHGFIRKAAHFTIYAILGCSVSWMFNVNTRKRKAVVFILSVALCFVYASTDEIHQLFSAGRSGKFSDVLIDTAGSVLGAGVYFCLRWIYFKLDYKFDGWITFTVIVMISICLLSSQSSIDSNHLSSDISHLFDSVYNFIASRKSDFTFVQFNTIVRKIAHFTMFFVLGAVTAAMLHKKSKLRIANIWLSSVLLSAFYAFCDEWHQTFVYGRSPLLSDVRIDISGALAGTILFILYCVFREGKKRIDLYEKVR